MQPSSKLVVLAFLILILASCNATQPPATKQQEPAQPAYRLTATVRDLMNAMIDPSADAIWDAVGTTITKGGKVEERRPKTDADWKTLEYRAIQMAEASNLLQMPGRHVGRPGEKNEQGIELQPEEIEALINKDRIAWDNYANGMHDISVETIKVIEAKNINALFELGEKIDTACENCHLKYWYPNDANAAAAAPNAGKQ